MSENMRKKSKTVRDQELRAHWMEKILKFVSESEDAQITGGNSFGFYTLDLEGEESAVKITVQVPKGSREGDEYDPVSEAQDYARKMKEKAEKAAKAAEAKAKKIEADKIKRQKIKEAKENREKPEVGKV